MNWNQPKGMPQHGSPADRGGADAYYGRARRPHKGRPFQDEQSTDLTPKEIQEYNAGYDAQTQRKEW